LPLVLRRIWDATWGRGFARGYDFFFRQMEEAGLREMRRELLSDARGRTLEIGAGTGLNHDLYPPAVTELVLTEPFPPMASQLREKVAGLDRTVEVVEAPAESLPFPDGSFDTVALTLVLCTVDDPGSSLAEIHRVLRPDGRFLFLEHVRAPGGPLARWQDRLRAPWYAFAHGCVCNRETLATIESSPLEVERAERGEIPRAVPLVRPMVRGTARAPVAS
jgi:ubiquinone/menaquinone biosynthesis C-methylase UbiE